jgi:type I restriction enzyme S subunit
MNPDRLPAGWAVSTLEATCEVVGGATPRTGDSSNWGDDVAWITPDDLSRHKGKYISRGRRGLSSKGLASSSATVMPPGTVLYTSRAPIGYVAIASTPVATNQGFKSLVPSQALHSDYLYWLMQHITPEIRALGSGTTFAEVSKRVIGAVEIPIPPVKEQQRIVVAIEEALSKLDAGSAYMEAIQRRLNRLRAAVVSRAVTGRLSDRDGCSTPGSEALPAHWSVCRLGEVTASQDYGTSAKSYADVTADDDIPVLRMGNIQNGRIDVAGLKYLPAKHPDFPAKLLAPGDVLFNRTNSPELVGKTAVYTGTPAAAAFASYLIRLRLTEAVTPEWVALYINSIEGRSYMASVRTQQVGQANVNGTKLAAMPIRIPPRAEQEQIMNEVATVDSFVETCALSITAQLTRAAALRRSTLGAAFAGRLVPQDASDEPAALLLERVASPGRTPKPRGPSSIRRRSAMVDR